LSDLLHTFDRQLRRYATGGENDGETVIWIDGGWHGVTRSTSSGGTPTAARFRSGAGAAPNGATVALRVAQLARERGYRYVVVDATPASRPILERLGFVA